MGGATSYRLNVLYLSIAFFCVFTAFSAIQNLEASVVKSGCKDCTHVCWEGDDFCVDQHESKVPSKGDLVCSYTDAVSGAKYCAKYGGKCKSTCPNNDGGWDLTLKVSNGSMNVTEAPAFDECGSGTNIGSIAIGGLYGVFTLCCIIGPYAVGYLGAKWSIASSFVAFCLFCAANFVVALVPSNTNVQWGLLVPSSALVGFVASIMWTAQGVYVTVNANKYAAALNMDKQAALGSFFGMFFGIFQTTQISGNLAASLLLDTAGWSTSTLMLFYLCFAGAGTLFAAVMVPNVSEHDDYDALDDDTTQDGDDDRASLWESIKGMMRLWRDKRMLMLIPLTVYMGTEQGFIWGAYTSQWVKTSLGIEKIGYVMAAFGGCDVVGSVVFGRLSDTVGRFPVMTFGALCHAGVLVMLYVLDIGNCDQKWGPLIAAACLWGLGDAVWNTQISCIMGDVFSDCKEDAYSNMKLWQSLGTSVIFFLGFNPDILTQRTSLIIITANLGLGYLLYACGYMCVGLRPSQEPKLVNSSV